jgi:hypothetical protein
MTRLASDLIDEIMTEALGALKEWEKPVAKPSVGPAYPEIADRFDVELTELRQGLIKKLVGLSVQELQENFLVRRHSRKYPLNDMSSIHFELVNHIVKLQRTMPAWFISGWHVAELEAEIPYWRSYTQCSLAQLNILSVGLDPRQVGYDALFQRYGHSEAQDSMLEFLEDRYEAIANGLGLDPNDQEAVAGLEAFYDWSTQTKFRLEARFQRMLRDRFQSNRTGPKPIASNNNLPSRPEALHGSRYDFHAKLIYAIAVEKFGLTDERSIGRTAKAIQNCTELQVGTASLQPIRQLLKRGFAVSSASTVPSEYVGKK